MNVAIQISCAKYQQMGVGVVERYVRPGGQQIVDSIYLGQSSDEEHYGSVLAETIASAQRRSVGRSRVKYVCVHAVPYRVNRAGFPAMIDQVVDHCVAHSDGGVDSLAGSQFLAGYDRRGHIRLPTPFGAVDMEHYRHIYMSA